VITSWAGGRVRERRASMCRLTFLQCGCVPGVCARDLVSDCQALIRQCNAAVFSVGEDTGRAGAGRQEGAVRQRQEVWRQGGRSANLHACGLPKLPPCSGSGIERSDRSAHRSTCSDSETACRCTCWTFHGSCDKGWLFKSERPMLKSVMLKVSSDQ
jgi:hypothetical protein